ncbi:DUF362 domain-containing protein [bacterium J10(2018)]|jgi:hypothetical protein|nr:DUF362 domain-containing protein [bacterium J10(2018)]
MKKAVMALAIATGMSMAGCTGTKAQTTATDAQGKELPKVYFIKEITPENIVKIYNALGRKAQGKNVAVKLSTGEAGNPNHLSPALIKDLVQSVNGTIIEGNTAYAGRRNTTADHLKTAEEHGFTAIADVDILDADGQVSLPIEGGRHLKEDIVGKNFLNYDFLMVLSHFKGHPMGGFGGALKNISIGIASPDGKANIHSAGKTQDVAKVWDMIPDQDIFQESMAEASKAIIDHVGDKVLYINVANNLSVDCDCVAEPEPVSMADIGIFASLDPVALDRACIDAVRNSDDHGKIHLIERIDSRHGMHNLEYAEQLGLGSQTYELVELK